MDFQKKEEINMRHLKQWLWLWIAALVLSSCGAPPTQAALVSTATQAATTAPAATQVEATATQSATATTAPSATAVSTATQAPTEVVDYCIDCHTDKDQLIQTAKVEEAKPKESEGAG